MDSNQMLRAYGIAAAVLPLGLWAAWFGGFRGFWEVAVPGTFPLPARQKGPVKILLLEEGA